MTIFERIVRAAARRPARVLVIVAVFAAVGCALALRLEPSAATDTLVGRGADTYKATERYREKFGDHSVIVLVRGELSNLLLTSNLGRLIGLEGCLSGNKPAKQQAPGGPNSPCGRLATLKPVKVVYGPGTFANASVGARGNSAAMANAYASAGYSQADIDALTAFQQEMMQLSMAASSGDARAKARLEAWEVLVMKYQPEMQKLSVAAGAGDAAAVQRIQRLQFDLIKEWNAGGVTPAKSAKAKH